MRIKYISNIENFFDMINSCKGEVALISNEGDRIVLTSKLSRFVVTLLNDSELLGDFEIQTSEKEDFERIVTYLMEQ